MLHEELESEIEDLKCRVRTLEGEIRIFTPPIHQLHRELLEFKIQFGARFDQALNDINERFNRLEERMNARFVQVDARFDRLEQKFDERFAQIDERFAQIDERFAQIDERFAQIDLRINNLEDRLNQMQVEMHRGFEEASTNLATFKNEINNRLDRIETRFDEMLVLLRSLVHK